MAIRISGIVPTRNIAQRESPEDVGARSLGVQDESIPLGSLAVVMLMVALFLVVHHGPPGHYQISASTVDTADEIASAIVGGSIRREIGLCILGVFGILILSTHRSSQLNGSGVFGLGLICYAGWSMASLFWADSFRLTLTRIGVMGAMMLGALALTEIASFKRLNHISMTTLGILVMIDVVAEIATGLFQPFKAEYRFSGTISPNHQAWNCALLLLSAVAAIERGSPWRIPACILAVLAAFCLALTGSRSAFIAVSIGLVFFWNLVLPKNWKVGAAAAFLAIACALLIVIDKPLAAEIKGAALLGRNDETVENLDGRFPVWTQCMHFVGKRPLLGYGFNAFWTPQHVEEISEDAGWGVPGAHNGYLDLLLGVGVVGFTLYVLVLAGGIYRATRFYRQSPTRWRAWCAALLVFFAITMLAEEIASQATFVNLVFITSMTKLAFNPR